jgi:hypothetical protein
VKKKRIYFALIYLVSACLLFNQVGLNFFHNKHDAHESYTLQSDGTQFHHHGEHCKVCALDTLFHLFFEASPEFHFQHAGSVAYSEHAPSRVTNSRAFIKGRAPPFDV